MNPAEDLIAHLQHFRAVSGDAQPTPDQWKEIQEKTTAVYTFLMTGGPVLLNGDGDMTKVTTASVGISC